jgi:hypothetical protein
MTQLFDRKVIPMLAGVSISGIKLSGSNNDDDKGLRHRKTLMSSRKSFKKKGPAATFTSAGSPCFEVATSYLQSHTVSLQIEDISLVQCELTSECFTVLVQQVLPQLINLQTLILDRNILSDAAANVLSGLLELDTGKRIADTIEAAALVQDKRQLALPSLHTVSVIGNPMSNAALLRLTVACRAGGRDASLLPSMDLEQEQVNRTRSVQPKVGIVMETAIKTGSPYQVVSNEQGLLDGMISAQLEKMANDSARTNPADVDSFATKFEAACAKITKDATAFSAAKDDFEQTKSAVLNVADSAMQSSASALFQTEAQDIIGQVAVALNGATTIVDTTGVMATGSSDFKKLQKRYKLQGEQSKALERLDAAGTGVAAVLESANNVGTRITQWAASTVATSPELATAGFETIAEKINVRVGVVNGMGEQMLESVKTFRAGVSSADEVAAVSAAAKEIASGPEAQLKSANAEVALLAAIEDKIKQTIATAEQIASVAALVGTADGAEVEKGSGWAKRLVAVGDATTLKQLEAAVAKLEKVTEKEQKRLAKEREKEQKRLAKEQEEEQKRYAKERDSHWCTGGYTLDNGTITGGGILFLVVSDDYDTTYADIYEHGNYPITCTYEVEPSHCGENLTWHLYCDGFNFYTEWFEDDYSGGCEHSFSYRLNGSEFPSFTPGWGMCSLNHGPPSAAEVGKLTLSSLAEAAGCHNAARAIRDAFAAR